jgi:phage-related protein
VIQVSSALRAKLFSAECQPLDLYELHLDSGIRYYSSEHITWEGHEYLPYVVDRSDVRRSEREIDSVTVTLSNVDTAIAQLLLTEPIEGRRLIIRKIDRSVAGDSIVLFNGLMDRPSRIDEKTAQITARELLGSIDVEVPARVFSPSCPWQFKGEECGYGGPETECNKSWARCQQLGNTARFGGFRFIPHSGVYQYKQVEKQRTWYTLGLWARKKEKTITAVFNAVDDVIYDLPIPIVLGRTQITGIPIQHVDEGGQTKVLAAFAAGACAQITYLRANGQVVTDWTAHSGQFGGEGNQLPDPRFPGAYPYSLLCYAGITVPSEVTQEDPAPAVDCVLLGSIVAVFDEQGNLVTTEWTDNPIWNVRHLLTLPLAQGGMGFPFDWIDDAHLAREAAYCEELITDVTGSQMIVVPPEAPVTPGDDYRRYQSTGVYGVGELDDGPYETYTPALDTTPPPPKQIKRFTLNVAIAKQEKAIDILQRKLFPAFRGYRKYSKDGKLQICVEKPEPNTSLVAAAAQGTQTLDVASVAGLQAGDLILLNPFTAAAEIAAISAVAPGQLSLAAPVQLAHEAGAVLHRIAMYFDDSSIVGDLEYPLADRQPSYNRVTIKYVDAPAGFEPRELRINDYEHQAQVRRVENLDVDGSAIDNYNQAWRIGQWMRAKARDLGRYITFRTDMRASLLEIGDVIAVSAGEVGLQAVPFRITEMSFLENDEVVLIGQLYSLGIYSDEAPQATLTVPAIFKPLTSLIPGINNLAAVDLALDGDAKQVRLALTGTAPDFESLSQFRVYVEIPQENDPDLEHPTLPGQMFFVGPQYAQPGQPVRMEIALPFPPDTWLAARYIPSQPLKITWIFYVLTETWDACQPLKRLTSLSPAAPADASPWVAVTLDFTNVAGAAAAGHLGPAIEPTMTTIEVVHGKAEIRLAYFPVYPSIDLRAVHVYTSTEQSPQNEPHGRWPYEGGGTTFPDAYGWVKVAVPLPTVLPAKLAVQLAGEWGDGYTRAPARILWDNGEPQNVPADWGTVVTLSGESVTLGAPSIQSAAVEYKRTEGGWAYRFAVTLAGSVLSQPQYGGSDVYVRFAGDAEPSEPSGWAQLRGIVQHRPGDSETVYSAWWPIQPGTSIQFWLRAVARDRSGVGRAWGDVAGPYSLHLPLGDAVPGSGHNWNFTAQLGGYWDDGNGIRYGRLNLSWTPLTIPGVVYGIYEYRSPESEPPPYSLYQPTEANTTESAITMWVPPPTGEGEYIHLALVAQLPAEGVWPKPSDYQDGTLPVTSVWLPQAGLSEQVSNWSVTVETDQSQDIPRGRFVFAFTPPSDPDFHHIHVYRRPADSLGNPLADWLPDKVASIVTGGPGGWWPLPSQPEYWLFKAVACNSLGQENTVNPPTLLVSVPASGGVTAGKVSPGAVTGPVSVDANGRVTINPGAIAAQHIGSVNADSIQGLIAASKIESIEASKITGLIQSSQIDSIAAEKITGQVAASQIQAVNANQINGVLQSSQIGSVNANAITGVIVTSQLADRILDSARLIASGVGISVKVASLPSLPNANYPDGCIVLRSSDKTLWKNQGGAWVRVDPSSELTGSLTSQDIASVSASAIVGLITAAQIHSINAGQITGSIQSTQIASIEASKITGSIQSTQIASIEASKITGSIQSTQIASIEASKITGSIQSSQIASIAADKITGTIQANQIASINANQISGLINNGQIDFIYANKLVSNSLDYAVGNLYVLGYINIASNPFSPGSGTLYCGSVSAYNWGVNSSGQGVFQSVQAYTGNFLTSLTVNGQTIGNAAFRNVGAGAGDVAAGNHTHTGYASSSHTHPITVTLAVQTATINYMDWYGGQQSAEVVTGVTVQSVSCGSPQ